jgi:hypothetical protein
MKNFTDALCSKWEQKEWKKKKKEEEEEEEEEEEKKLSKHIDLSLLYERTGLQRDQTEFVWLSACSLLQMLYIKHLYDEPCLTT